MQHINSSCHFKWKEVAQARSYSRRVGHLGIKIVLMACFCEGYHSNNLSPPKRYLKLSDQGNNTSLQMLLFFCRNCSISKCQIQLLGRFLPLQQNSFLSCCCCSITQRQKTKKWVKNPNILNKNNMYNLFRVHFIKYSTLIFINSCGRIASVCFTRN